MERLCDEVLQLIFYELTDPGPLAMVSRRFYRFSQDPYVRANYFLIHYGPIEAMYYALGRGKLLNERVLDILLSSGAQLSRYLIQIALHHYFHTQSHFVKSPWVRGVSLRVFLYFMKIAEERYGEIPRGRNEDDGSVFSIFLKEGRVSSQSKTFTWETIKTLMETYKFIPFCHRDPLTPQFPLALAIEPRLLPYAVANGFSMDYKYRDFVFRKMFERPTSTGDLHADDVAQNVRELCKLDPVMFVSRTIAAEVCMEAKSNEVGYNALRQLDKSGDLRFELSTLVEDLLRTFLTTRSICSASTGEILLHLFTEFPSTDPTVRLVMLIVVFISADDLHVSLTALRAKLEGLGLMPITRRDIFNILVNPFVEKFTSLVSFASEEIGIKEDGSKGMTESAIEELATAVAVKCFEISCKGKLVRRLCDTFPNIKNVINNGVLSKYQVEMADIPSWEDDMDCGPYRAALSRDFIAWGAGEVHTPESLMPEQQNSESVDLENDRPSRLDLASNERAVSTDKNVETEDDLGEISQETLTTMIRQDESVPVRSRRRNFLFYYPTDLSGKIWYPHDALHIAKWAKTQYGPRSAIVAVFMTHAVINGNSSILHHYLTPIDVALGNNSSYVPLTLKHFQFLARLGRTPSYYLWQAIQVGAQFLFNEDDYLSEASRAIRQSAKQKVVKTESVEGDLSPPSTSPSGDRKRPRRSATVVRSYAVPDSESDDESVYEKNSMQIKSGIKRKMPQETNLQLWIKHLNLLLKTETRKHTRIKKRLDKEVVEGPKVSLPKNDFIKSLVSNLRVLRKLESELRAKNPIQDAVEEYSDDEDDEYIVRRMKRRNIAVYA